MTVIPENRQDKNRRTYLAYFMKRIRIFTHVACEPPGYIQDLLERLAYPFEQVCLFDGKSVPTDLDDIAALVLMGGPGDVNQPTEWMQQEMSLIRTAMAKDVPVLGICLGAQLMSKAMGGWVREAESVEVGWHSVRLLPEAATHPLFKGLPLSFQVFQWHAHSFSVPDGAQSVATSECTECQAYVQGKNLALQFHLEMTDSIICSLLEKYAEDLVGTSTCVQTSEQIRENIQNKTQQTFAIADVLIERWLHSVMRS